MDAIPYTRVRSNLAKTMDRVCDGHALSGYWSRRITDEHRLVYKVEGDALLIAQLRYHY